MRKRFGSQVLDNIINERLILAATRQKGLFITDSEINDRIKQIETRLDGQTSIDDALKLQGMTKQDLRRQLEIQIAIDKLFEKESTVSGSEIEDYIGKNKEIMNTSTDTAKLREDVKSTLQQQKTAEAFDKWFQEIRQSAKINKYL